MPATRAGGDELETSRISGVFSYIYFFFYRLNDESQLNYVYGTRAMKNGHPTHYYHLQHQHHYYVGTTTDGAGNVSYSLYDEEHNDSCDSSSNRELRLETRLESHVNFIFIYVLLILELIRPATTTNVAPDTMNRAWVSSVVCFVKKYCTNE
jgi:hypothetical protein